MSKQDKAPSGVVNVAHQDTTPGAGTVFAPPAGFAGDYKALMRERWRSMEWRQLMQATASLARPSRLGDTFTGPYAKEARQICSALVGG